MRVNSSPSPAESAEVVILLSSNDKEVNASSSIKLRCVAYGNGGLSAPSIEWTSVTNERTSIIIGNSTSTRVIIVSLSTLIVVF